MPTENLNNERDLLSRIANGDEQAFRRLTYLYSERVFFHALTFVKSWHRAEELVQDVFLRVWQKREKLQQVEDWNKYLFTLTRNCLINSMKRKASDFKFTELGETEDSFSPDDQHDRKELAVLLEKAINHLPAQRQAVFKMIYFEGRNQEEVSRCLRIATRTVRWNLVTAMNEIRDFLHRYSPDAFYCFLIILSLNFF
ncbi:MAG: sigma-70 family RNA polymerase sigma factor [Chitinophagaceae bacterium]|nr:sigma-70 family RNA polymerase sigma factor [Chitinophagaceae bacterium]